MSVTDRREYTIGTIYLVLTSLCWGFVASTVKRLRAEVDPYTLSFLRVVMASAVFVLLFLLQRGDWRRLKWFAPWIIVGAVGRAANYLLYNTAMGHVPSNAATLLAPVQAISIVILARVFLRESVRAKWFGLALSLTGLLLIWWNGQGVATLADPRYAAGNLLLALSGLSSAFQFTAQKALAGRFSGTEILLPVFALSTIITAPFAWSAGGFSHSYAPATWAWLLFLGVILTGGSFFLLGEGYKRCDASTGVVITNTSTFWTLLWSALLMRESVSAVMVLGAVLGVAGTLAVIRADRRRI